MAQEIPDNAEPCRAPDYESVMTILDVIAVIAFVSALIAFPFSFYNFHRRPVRSVLIFAVPALLFFGACDLSGTVAQVQILADCDRLSSDYHVTLDGKQCPNPAEALSALKTLRSVPQHHSYPTKRIRVEAFDRSRKVVVLIARDSRDPREYWVFSSNSLINRHIEVGRLMSSAFDGY